MDDLEWKDEYSVGIPALDIQHRHIFDCFVTIAAGSTEHDGLRAEFAFSKLVGLLQEHFRLEESMMRAFSYPELEPHIEEHRQFHSDVRDLAQRSIRTKGGVSRETIKVAQKWLREHIATSDRDYMVFFSNPAHKSGGNKPGSG